jgi:hypothetical protein
MSILALLVALIAIRWKWNGQWTTGGALLAVAGAVAVLIALTFAGSSF